MMDLSIIVPVYNVEKYIRPCIESIFNQGLDDNCFEVIIVNDGTTDNSMEMITDILRLHNNVIVINQENQGLSVARNNGIAIAKGEYILMPDSDDLLIDNSVRFLLDKALSTKVDLVVADFQEINCEEVEMLKMCDIHQKDGYTKEKSGEQLFLEDLHPRQCYVWRILFRRMFLLENNISFYPGICFQDVPFTHECYIKAKRTLRINWLMNIYRKNRTGSATFNFSIKKAQEFCTTIRETWRLKSLTDQSIPMKRKIENDVFTSCSVLLWSTSHTAKNAAERAYVIDMLKEMIPDLHFQYGLKHRIVSFMLKWMPHILVNCRYLYDIILEDRILPFYRHNILKLIKK